MQPVGGLLRYQIDFTTWATERMLAATAPLSQSELDRDFKTADKSLAGTLVHCYRAERIWLNRLNGIKADFKVPGDDTLSALRTNWPKLRQDWADWARVLTDENAAGDVTYSDLKGNPWTHPVWIVVLHVVNHSTHHRGQVAGFLRALGCTPPPVDLIAYARRLS